MQVSAWAQPRLQEDLHGSQCEPLKYEVMLQGQRQVECVECVELNELVGGGDSEQTDIWRVWGLKVESIENE